MKTTIISILTLCLISPLVYADNNRNRSAVFGKTSELETQIQTNTTNIQSLVDQIQSNTDANTAQDDRIQANTDANAAQDASIQANTDANTAQDARIQANTDANTAQDSQIQANTTAVGDAANQVTVLQSEVGDLYVEVQTNTDDIASNSSRITALENSSGGGGTTPPAPNTINFLDYIPVAGIKEFQEITSNPVACQIIRYEISRTDNASDSDILFREIYTNGSVNCAINDYDYKLTDNALSVVGYKNISMFTFTNFSEPGNVLNDTMEVGKSFGFAITSILHPGQIVLQNNTVLGIEAVTVPAGAFNDCLKIHTAIKSNLISPNYEGVSWLCPNVGEVKRVYYDRSANTYQTRQLTSIQ